MPARLNLPLVKIVRMCRTGKLVPAIADYFGVSRYAIWSRLKRAGVTSRYDHGRFNLVGKQFGRLKVLRYSHTSRTREAFWLVLCGYCGKKKAVRGSSLRKGSTKSCGCQRILSLKKPGRRTSTYRSWCAMRTRCTNPNQLGWKNYGGRGIKVCKRWSGKSGFDNFIADMGPRPVGTTLDRYPNGDGNYEPGNCRWATNSQQANNRRVWQHEKKKKAA